MRLFAILPVLVLALAACGRSSAPAGPGIIDVTPQDWTEAALDQYCGSTPREECKIPPPYKVDFALTDHHGKAVTDETYEGKVMVLYYGFASCPDICPAALGNMAAVLDELGGKADEVEALFVTIDPERDTPEVLAAHLGFEPRITGLTGSEEAAAAAREGLKVYAQKIPMPESALGYTMQHQDFFYITDRAGNPLRIVEGSLPPSRTAKVLRWAMKQ